MNDSDKVWLPIATAPKDGTAILVCGGTYDWDQSWNSEGVPFKFVATVCWYNGAEEGWQGDNSGGHDEFFWYEPVYWTPEPKPHSSV